MAPAAPPYRTQELRAPEAPPEPWWPNLKRLLAVVAASMCCGPCLYLFASGVPWLVAGVAGGFAVYGLAVAVRGALRRRPRLVWRGVTLSAAGALALGFPVGDHCAQQREKNLIAAVHAWRATHGSYPDSLAVLPPPPAPFVCRVPRLPNLVSGRITYWNDAAQDDAMLTRTLYGFYRRIYRFRSRRFSYLD